MGVKNFPCVLFGHISLFLGLAGVSFRNGVSIPPVVADLFPHTLRSFFLWLCGFLKDNLIPKMVEPLYVTSHYLVFSPLVQIISPKFLVSAPVFQYVVAHNENLMKEMALEMISLIRANLKYPGEFDILLNRFVRRKHRL